MPETSTILRHCAAVKYAFEGQPNKVMAAEYRTALVDEKSLAHEIQITRRQLAEHKIVT